MVATLFIVGKGRSGSTLLDQLLATRPGWFSAGELDRLWDWGVRDRVACACGTPIPECPVWSGVLASVDVSLSDVAQILQARSGAMSWPAAPRNLGGKMSEPASQWRDLMTRTYHAIALTTRTRVVVDSTKWPAHPALISPSPDVATHVVHIVRDPRAVTFSWQRQKAYRDRDDEMPRFRPTYSALSWSAKNGLAELARRRARVVSWVTVRYEDLVENPETVTAEIARAVDDTSRGGETMTGLHTIGGNPSKSPIAPREIRSDDEWIHEIGGGAAAVTTALTAPFLGSYGYPLNWRRDLMPNPSR